MAEIPEREDKITAARTRWPTSTSIWEKQMSNGEGGLRAPVRDIVAWQDEDYWDEEKLDEETRRQFDVCHGCRRCFNLCDSFPKLFDLIDESETYELDSVKSEDFKPIVDACTMCDMCFMVTCPYVPPHEFAICPCRQSQ